MAGAAAFGRCAYSARGSRSLPDATCCRFCNDRRRCAPLLASFEAGCRPPASQARLVRMRARGVPPGELAERPALARTAVRTVEELTAAPPLVLTEGQS